MKKEKYNILLVDDHAIMLDGIHSILKDVEFIDSFYKAQSGEEALSILNSKEIHLVVLDISIGDMSGLEILKIIRSASNETKVLMLSMYCDIEHISEAIRLGTNGYMTKGKASASIKSALEALLDGHSFYSDDVNGKMRSFMKHTNILRRSTKNYDLSEPDIELLELISRGKTMKEIAEVTSISPRTVEKRTQNLMLKMNVKNRITLVVKAIKENIIEV